MATLASSHREHVGAHAVAAWTPQAALRYAWFAYLALLVIPAILLLYTVWSNDHAGEGVGDRDLATRWFIACVAYVVVVVPASFFVRSRFFRAYWTAGQCVSPRNYFMGMMTTWVALEVAGLLSITGCLVTRTFAPCILPAVVAFMTFVALWPSGRAMVCRDRGESDDPEKYEEPR